MAITKEVKRVNTVIDTQAISEDDYILHVWGRTESPNYDFYTVTSVTLDKLELSATNATRMSFTANEASEADLRVIQRAKDVLADYGLC